MTFEIYHASAVLLWVLSEQVLETVFLQQVVAGVHCLDLSCFGDGDFPDDCRRCRHLLYDFRRIHYIKRSKRNWSSGLAGEILSRGVVARGHVHFELEPVGLGRCPLESERSERSPLE